MQSVKCLFPKLNLSLDVYCFIGEERIDEGYYWLVDCLINPGFSRRCVGQQVHLCIQQQSALRKIVGTVVKVRFHRLREHQLLQLTIEPNWHHARKRAFSRIYQSAPAAEILQQCFACSREDVYHPALTQPRDWLQTRMTLWQLAQIILAKHRLSLICLDDGRVRLIDDDGGAQTIVADEKCLAISQVQTKRQSQCAALSQQHSIGIGQYLAHKQRHWLITHVKHYYCNPQYHNCQLSYINSVRATLQRPIMSTMPAALNVGLARVLRILSRDRIEIQPLESQATLIVPWLSGVAGPEQALLFTPQLDSLIVYLQAGITAQDISIIGSYDAARQQVPAEAMCLQHASEKVCLPANAAQASVVAGQHVAMTSQALCLHAQQDSSLYAEQQLTLLCRQGSVHLQAQRLRFQVGTSELVLSAHKSQLSAKQLYFHTSSQFTGALTTVGDQHSCITDASGFVHGTGRILSGSANVRLANYKLARQSDKVSCAKGVATITQGLDALLVNGKAAAMLAASTSHGGKLLTAKTNVNALSQQYSVDEPTALSPSSHFCQLLIRYNYCAELAMVFGMVDFAQTQVQRRRIQSGRARCWGYHSDRLLLVGIYLDAQSHDHYQALLKQRQRSHALRRTRL